MTNTQPNIIDTLHQLILEDPNNSSIHFQLLSKILRIKDQEKRGLIYSEQQENDIIN